jgi:hypothetical protein
MFMQIIQGPVGDQDAARATLERWHRDLKPDAAGWLGGTYGFTDDGTLVAVVRFGSAEAARRNAERPEQREWWREMQAHFTGEVTFHDCTDVMLLLGGGSDDAQFVQVIQGRVRDRERARELVKRTGELISAHRPDVMGATIAIDDGGFFTETVAFTSETAARDGEQRELPAEARQLIDEEMSLLEDVQYLDLHHPWFASQR